MLTFNLISFSTTLEIDSKSATKKIYIYNISPKTKTQPNPLNIVTLGVLFMEQLFFLITK